MRIQHILIVSFIFLLIAVIINYTEKYNADLKLCMNTDSNNYPDFLLKSIDDSQCPEELLRKILSNPFIN